MADVLQKVKDFLSGIVGILISFAVLLVFANIVFDTGFDPVGGIVSLVQQFLTNGFAGLLALVVFVWFLSD
ncbi:MAG: hypothetical protein D6762_04085 [Candidatus Neomarinimicrobiota bacterium]|nr:MAG: hypothetical protein D6762_04085 [Candidatus Neomarinimicrobiota bacterium]